MQTTGLLRGWLVGGALTLGACADEAAGPAAVVACDPATDERGQAVACVGGALVDDAGEPVGGVKVSACTEKTCIIGTTADDGSYAISKLPVLPHKIEILGAMKGFATMVFFQDVQAGVMAFPTRDVTLVRLEGAAVPWPVATGGVASALDGRVVFEAEPETLKYPAGTIDKEIQVMEVDPRDLPPFDVEPWKGKEGKSLAFLVNPFPLKASVSVDLTVTGVEAAAGALYTLYAAHPVTGRLEQAGIMMADGEGALELQPGASLVNLTTLVVVPN